MDENNGIVNMEKYEESLKTLNLKKFEGFNPNSKYITHSEHYMKELKTEIKRLKRKL